MSRGSPGRRSADVGPIRAHLTGKFFFVAEDESVGRMEKQEGP